MVPEPFRALINELLVLHPLRADQLQNRAAEQERVIPVVVSPLDFIGAREFNLDSRRVRGATLGQMIPAAGDFKLRRHR